MCQDYTKSDSEVGVGRFLRRSVLKKDCYLLLLCYATRGSTPCQLKIVLILGCMTTLRETVISSVTMTVVLHNCSL